MRRRRRHRRRGVAGQGLARTRAVLVDRPPHIWNRSRAPIDRGAGAERDTRCVDLDVHGRARVDRRSCCIAVLATTLTESFPLQVQRTAPATAEASRPAWADARWRRGTNRQLQAAGTGQALLSIGRVVATSEQERAMLALTPPDLAIRTAEAARSAPSARCGIPPGAPRTWSVAGRPVLSRAGRR